MKQHTNWALEHMFIRNHTTPSRPLAPCIDTNSYLLFYNRYTYEPRFSSTVATIRHTLW